MRILVLGGGKTLEKSLRHIKEDIVFAAEEGTFDLAAILPGEPRRGRAFSCGTLLLWEEGAEEWLQSISAEQVISCGYSPQNTLTPASIEPGRSVLTVQRELKRPDGTYVWPQDLRLPERWGALPLPQQMMLTGLCLLGVEPG